MEVLKKVTNIIVDVADIPESEISGDSLLIDDLDLASLEIFAITSKIEQEFSVSISEKELLSVETVNDIVKLIASK